MNQPADFASRDDARAFLAQDLGIDLDADNAAAEFESLLAAWPRDWEPLTPAQVADIRRALDE